MDKICPTSKGSTQRFQALRARAFDGIVPEAEAIMASEELRPHHGAVWGKVANGKGKSGFSGKYSIPSRKLT